MRILTTLAIIILAIGGYAIYLQNTRQIEVQQEIAVAKKAQDDASQKLLLEAQAGESRTFSGIEMVWCPPGSFRMGSSLKTSEIAKRYGDDGEHYRDERPVHMVTFKTGFWMGAYEVTNAEFGAFIDATGYMTDAEKGDPSYGFNKATGKYEDIQGLSWRNPGRWSPSPKEPVVLVSWNDAQAYIRWLNQKSEGDHFSLPSESEWEYACRAGSVTEFFWGDNADSGKGYLNAASLKGGPNGDAWTDQFNFNDGYVAVAPVGVFKPNAWGLYDMHGNVCEWCQDWKEVNYVGVPTNGSAMELLGGKSRVVRGGSWTAKPRYCRAAFRFGLPRDDRRDILGFRLLRTPSVKKAQADGATAKKAQDDAAQKLLRAQQAGRFRTFSGVDMVWCPPGSFQMGNYLSVSVITKRYGGAVDSYQYAQPVHRVTFQKGFWMGAYEVTNAEFGAFVEATGYTTDAEKGGSGVGFNKDTVQFETMQNLTWRNPGCWTPSPKEPVVLVSWNDAQAYIRWLNQKSEGDHFRLPNESEWEYACRAGSVTEFFWGDDPDDGEGYLNAASLEGAPNGDAWTNQFNFNDGYVTVSPVGVFKPNAFGLYDMLGNVREWCQDRWHISYAGAPADGSAWEESPDLEYRVIRGGSWRDQPGYSHPAFRDLNSPDYRRIYIGFRLLRTP